MPYRRRLPHLYLDGQPLFITWHLSGSLPDHRFPPPHSPSAGKAFVWMDRQLDSTNSGPMWLLREDVARVVVEALHYGAETLGYYELHAFVVMSNHVHVLLTPRVDPVRLLKSVKGFTARQANRILGRTGEAFWQPESYDHLVRNTAEMDRILQYIEGQPRPGRFGRLTCRLPLVQRAPLILWSGPPARNADILVGAPPTDA